MVKGHFQVDQWQIAEVLNVRFPQHKFILVGYDPKQQVQITGILENIHQITVGIVFTGHDHLLETMPCRQLLDLGYEAQERERRATALVGRLAIDVTDQVDTHVGPAQEHLCHSASFGPGAHNHCPPREDRCPLGAITVPYFVGGLAHVHDQPPAGDQESHQPRGGYQHQPGIGYLPHKESQRSDHQKADHR